MAETKKFSDTLVILLTGTNTVAQPKIEEALKSAKSLNVPLERALVMLGHASDISLKSIIEAQELVKSGRISLEMAVKALRFAKQNHLELAEAINVLTSVHQKTAVVQSVTNELSQLLLESQMITREQFGAALKKSTDSGMTIGRILVINRDLSNWMMNSALNAYLLMKQKKIAKEDAVTALQAVGRRRITIEQALFELNLYRETPGQTIRLGELFQMSGFLGDGDMLECLEIELVKEKQFGQILLEQGHATHSLLEAAVYLQDMIANDTIRAYQAAEALRSCRTRDVSVYQAVAELRPPPQLTPPPPSFVDLLVNAGIAPGEGVSDVVDSNEESSVKAGKRLLKSGFVNEVMLYTALRTYSLLREGYVSNESAVNILTYCAENNLSVDEALLKLALFAPSRMQWLWV
jgi:hypothetical protein